MKFHDVIIDQRESDYCLGVNSPIEFRVANPSNDWTQDLPDFDPQKIGNYESEACVPFSATQSIETQINRAIRLGQVPSATMDWLQQNGYLEPGAKIHLSERFMAKMDGTDPATGTPLRNPWDAARKYGCLPWADWPFDGSIDSDAEFYATVPQNLLDKAKQFLQYFSFQYHWVVNNGNALGTPITILKTALQQAPVCIGINVCGDWNEVSPVPCTDLTPQHSVMLYDMDTVSYILDHYAPFTKKLPFQWNIGYAMQGIVNVIPPPPPPPPTISQPITVPQQQQVSSWLTAVSAWIQSLLAQLKGARFAGEPPRSSEWGALRNSVVKEVGKCEWCGCKKNLQAHHCAVFHLHPEMELRRDNIIVLCECSAHHCHLRHGHFGNFKDKFNPNIKQEAPLWFQRFQAKTEEEATKVA